MFMYYFIKCHHFDEILSLTAVEVIILTASSTNNDFLKKGMYKYISVYVK